MDQPTNVVAIPNGRGNFSLTPQSLDEAMRFADILSKSSIVPKDFQGNPGNILVAVQWGAELGLPPLQAMQSIAVINGRPAMWGDAVIALVKGSGLLETIREDIGTDAATCTVKRRGEEPASRTFTTEDAKKAGLFGKQGPWQQYPKRMLQMRARSWALRDVFPDVLRGVYVAEEAQDMPPEKDMGQAQEVGAQAPEKPRGRADRVRAALDQKRQPKGEQSTTGALASISSAPTLDDLHAAAAAAAASLVDEEERARAREAFKTRRAELERHAAEPPGDTLITYAQVRAALEKAKDADERAIAADLIGEIADEGQRAELSAVYADLRAKLAE